MAKNLAHLLLTTVEDPFNPKTWSGTLYSLREALERKLPRLTVFRPDPPVRRPLDVALRIWHGGKPPKAPLWMTKATLEQNARQLKAKIAEVRPDAVLAVSSQTIVNLLEPACPVFLFSDCDWWTWQMTYKGTIPETVRRFWYAEQEARAARRIDGLCFGSGWAVREAAKVYSEGAPAGSTVAPLHVTEFGANWVPSLRRAEVLACAAQRPGDRIDLLFVGKDWVRKGGPLALEVAREIHARGHVVRLHIVSKPELTEEAKAYATVYGPLFRDDPEQNRTLQQLFLSSHFLLVPTLAECFGIVFAEAQAFALPPVSRAIHAVPDVVVEGETGILLEQDATAAMYADKILQLHADRDAYRRMAENARRRFEGSLNWDHTAERLIEVISASL